MDMTEVLTRFLTVLTACQNARGCVGSAFLVRRSFSEGGRRTSEAIVASVLMRIPRSKRPVHGPKEDPVQENEKTVQNIVVPHGVGTITIEEERSTQ
jgi:hypothetical protein